MRDRDLRASLINIGAQIPGLEHNGELIDGRKKALMCAELAIPFEIRQAKTLQDACSILWTQHPDRALELARTQTEKLLELAALCGVTSVAVAKEIQANRPKKKPLHKIRAIEGQPYPKLKETRRMLRRLITIEPELYAYALEAAAQIGHRNFSRLARDAIWEKVGLIVPMAPQFQPRRVEGRIMKRSAG